LTSKEDARWLLREYLEGVTIDKPSGNKMVVDPETCYKIAIQAWNKWRTKEAVRALKPTKDRKPPL